MALGSKNKEHVNHNGCTFLISGGMCVGSVSLAANDSPKRLRTSDISEWYEDITVRRILAAKLCFFQGTGWCVRPWHNRRDLRGLCHYWWCPGAMVVGDWVASYNCLIVLDGCIFALTVLGTIRSTTN